ncbi:uncharacterized protein cubi_00910 [Cryptosporidium ubiquitum]|uniref:Uncharacterized protein n=1 Tax=Cryptosporidium ubiquitum TaxID=857276 RepID=A0A1J4MD23_9CRYT|nr:uncharacterized protein cubi_00910 [Cryptosporidium ubiquitum]OII70765.1 hypothetical protein cubi_00910 [Cryptosporidium ubiquitum]
MGWNLRIVHCKNRYVRFLLTFLIFITVIFCKQVLCGSKTQLEDPSDYNIDFFRKTGKYPSNGYLESNGIYGTPLILKSQDSTLWIILLGVCFAALIFGIGIAMIANFGGEVKVNEDGLDKMESNEYFYDPLESPEEEIKRLNKLQGKLVDSFNYPNPNNYNYHHHPQFSQFGNYYNSNQHYYSSKNFR